MTVRRTFSVVIAFLAMLAGGGCGDRDGAPLPAETDEPYYVQGKQLMRQGRNPEALTAFLKVIERRGERGAPESHLEAGNIYLKYIKDPVEAYHHFRKYLTLKPNSTEAAGARGMVEAARREFARTLPARPLDDQSLKMQADDELERLRRENEELRAQIATLRGRSELPVTRAAPVITLPEESPSRGATPSPGITATESGSASAPPRVSSSSPLIQAPSATQPPAARSGTPTRSTVPAGRTHTVAPKDTLYGISMKYYGNGRQVDAIYQANRDQMRNKEDVRPGMTLRLPAVDGTAGQKR